MRVSQVMTKQQVLTLYLNEIYLGNNSYGIAAAAQTYFDKPLSQIDIAQAASLAALPKAPTNYDPFLHPQDALARRNFVIGRMLADGAITAGPGRCGHRRAAAAARRRRAQNVPNGGYFADAVKAQLVQHFGADSGQPGRADRPYQPEPGAAARRRPRRCATGWSTTTAPMTAGTAWSRMWTTRLSPTTGSRTSPNKPIPPGMRQDWHLGIVLDPRAAPRESATSTPRPRPAGNRRDQPRYHALGPPGGARRMAGRPDAVSEVLHPGDIIMVSGLSPAPGAGADPQHPGRADLHGPAHRPRARHGRRLEPRCQPLNRVTQAQRQPGSSVKPFVYLTAMEQGIQPDAPVLDGALRAADARWHRLPAGQL